MSFALYAHLSAESKLAVVGGGGGKPSWGVSYEDEDALLQLEDFDCRF